MKRLILMIVPALSVMRKNVKWLVILLIVAGFFSCDKQSSLPEEDDSSTIFEPYETENVRLAKILKYSNSSASKLTGEVVYTYDRKGNLINERSSYFDDFDGTMTLSISVEYEYSGKKKVKESYFSGNNPYSPYYAVAYLYEGDFLVKEVRNSGWGDDPVFYEYDKRGNLVKRSWYATNPLNHNPDPNTIYEHKYTYDAQDRLILEENSLIGVSDYDHKYIRYNYDNHDREKKIEYLNTNWVLIRYTEKSYNETNVLEFRYDKNGKQTAKYQHLYDKWGNLTETVINDECSMFKRKYDGGLLIEEIHYWAHEYGYHFWGQAPESGMSRYEYEEIE